MSCQGLLYRFSPVLFTKHPVKSADIARIRLRGDCRSVLVVTRKCHDPAYKLPLDLLNAIACRKGWGRIARFDTRTELDDPLPNKGAAY